MDVLAAEARDRANARQIAQTTSCGAPSMRVAFMHAHDRADARGGMNRLLATLLTCCAAALALAAPMSAPAATTPAVPLPSATDLDAYLAGKGSPMAGQGGAFLASGGRWQLDPRLLVAIAGAESNFGSITCAPFNGWGWGCPNGPYNFDSWADGIDTVAEGLRTNYLSEGRTSVALINLKYAPIGAANDPTGLNNHWTTNVSKFLVELGGDPSDIDIYDIGGTRSIGAAPLAAASEFGFAESEDDAPEPGTDSGLVVAAGTPRPLIVTVENAGSATWTAADVRLRRIDTEQRIGGAPYGNLVADTPSVAPGASARFVVQLAARGAHDGAATTRWRLEGPSGAFGPEISREVTFEVPAFVSGESTVEIEPANSGIAGGTSAWTIVVHVRNAGSEAWERDGAEGVLLGLVADQPNTLLGEGWVNADVAARMLERRVAPGEDASFAFRVRGEAGATATLRPFRASGWSVGEAVTVTLI